MTARIYCTYFLEQHALSLNEDPKRGKSQTDTKPKFFFGYAIFEL